MSDIRGVELLEVYEKHLPQKDLIYLFLRKHITFRKICPIRYCKTNSRLLSHDLYYHLVISNCFLRENQRGKQSSQHSSIDVKLLSHALQTGEYYRKTDVQIPAIQKMVLKLELSAILTKRTHLSHCRSVSQKRKQEKSIAIHPPCFAASMSDSKGKNLPKRGKNAIPYTGELFNLSYKLCIRSKEAQ